MDNNNNMELQKPPLWGGLEGCFRDQLTEWDLAKQNYEALKKVKTKEFAFDDFKIRVQFNPARIQSSAAKVDSQSIKERRCFLCPANLPKEQRGLSFGKDYLILVNPYPIFPKHLTIPSRSHTDQLIFDRFGDMLDLAESLDNFVIFYNGPKCGASAPDHVHFQAGSKGFLPLEEDVKSVSKKEIHFNEKINIYILKNYLRNPIVIESTDKYESERVFREIYSLLEIKDGETEPMMNVLSWYENGKWTTAVFPREIHRPKCFYAEGDGNILISPASVDMGGVFITPRENDFDKINADDIREILKEVCISDNKRNEVVNKLIELQD